MSDHIYLFRDNSLEGPSYVSGNPFMITYAEYCDFCEKPLLGFDNYRHCELSCPFDLDDTIHWSHVFPPRGKTHLGICNHCGFWIVWDDKFIDGVSDNHSYRYVFTRSARGVLKDVDLSTNCEELLAEVKAYLLAKYESRFYVNPIQMEKLVASIYKSAGFDVIQTAQSNDGGIDIYLLSNGQKLSAIQVKRTVNKIQAEQIRAFAGALILDQCLSGIYVTTSQFTKGAAKTVERYRTIGININTVDSEEMLRLLGCTMRSPYSFPEANPAELPFHRFASNPESMPFLGEAVYMNGYPLTSCRIGFDQNIAEIDKHDLARKTLSRARRIESALLKQQLTKLSKRVHNHK